MILTISNLFGWICASLTIIGFYLITYLTPKWMLYGFIIGLVADLLWIAWSLTIVGIESGSSLLITNAFMAIVATKGIHSCYLEKKKLPIGV
jgi:hypothetical protein